MPKRPILTVFLLALAIFGFAHATPGFGDPDAYYHLEIAKLSGQFPSDAFMPDAFLTVENRRLVGPIRAFPWLPFTTLADHYADQHFLYHVALIPFLNLFGDFLGLKIATVLFAALAVATFAWLLRTYGVRRPLLWTLPLLIANGFVFRILLTKASAPALIAFFLALGFLKTKRRLALFILAFAYVWLHAGWPILGVMAFVYAVLRRDLKTFLVVVAGLAAGLVFNPFFPANILFDWEQIVQIAVIGHRDPAVSVGNEWYPADFGYLIGENFSIFLVITAAFGYMASLIYTKEKPPEVGEARRRDIVFIVTLACFFLLMTLRQVRQKEYFLPLALMTAALLGDALSLDTRATFEHAKARLGRAFRPLSAACAILLIALAAHSVWYLHDLYAKRKPFSRFAAVGSWTRDHLPAGEIIFHGGWDDFPYLFYRDDTHRYIAGMDPMFLYRQDPATYWLWRDISDGRRRVGVSNVIEEKFGAHYVFVRRTKDALRPIIEKDPSFERVYQDDEAEVWRITR